MKTIQSLILTLLVAFGAISCIPTGVNPSTTGTPFAINMQADRESFTQLDTTILIDGDSLKFYVQCFNFFDNTDYLIIGTTSTAYEYLNVKNYYHHINTNELNTTDTSMLITDVNAVDGNTLINNSYSAHPWQPFVLNNNQYIGLSILYRTSLTDTMYVNGLFKNKDQYIVFRKLKGTQYQYYWIKVRNNEVAGLTNTIQILNGKYQLNSITTGQ